MKISGIVCEYNPFHNGHFHHIEKTRQNGATHIIGVMSGNFVQRGDTAIMNKFERAELAVKNGIDLIIEIPVIYCLSPAELYARGAVSLLNSLGCVNELSFGSECGKIDLLNKAMEASSECTKNPELKKLMEMGLSYPSALARLVTENYDKIISEIILSPNNLLGIEYLRQLKFFNSKILPFTVLRKDAPHDNHHIKGENIASASFIRKNISQVSDFENFVPRAVIDRYISVREDGGISDFYRLEQAILYKLRTVTIEEIKSIPDVGQGLEYRIHSAKNACSLEELMHTIKTKRYPMARIRRILINMLIGVKKSDIAVLPPYVRILAFNERGREILSISKKTAALPIGTSLAKLSNISPQAKRFAEIESLSTDIYSLSLEKIKPCHTDFKYKIKYND